MREQIDLFAIVRSYVRTHALCDDDARILVALSGGSDSVLLLDILYRLGYSVGAAHVNHHMRAGEAERDEAFCRDLCRARGIPLVCLDVDAPAVAKAERKTPEEAARSVRYRAIAAYLAEHPLWTHLATAHHADDRLETVLQRVIRGTGTDGLQAICPRRDFPLPDGRTVGLIRPLLCLTKADILNDCDVHKLQYVCDSTNEDERMTRNALRRRVLPSLCKINPAYPAAIDRLCNAAAEDADYFRGEVATFLSEHRTENGVSRRALCTLHPAILHRVLSALYADCAARELERRPSLQLEAVHLHAMTRQICAFSHPGQTALPHSVTFCCYDDTVFFRKEERAPGAIRGILLHTGENRFDGFCLFVQTPDMTDDVTGEDLTFARINRTAFENGLYVYSRAEAPSQRYIVRGHTHLLKKLISDARVPQAQRETLPVLCDDSNQLVYVPFCPVADAVMPQNGKEVVEIIYYRNPKKRAGDKKEKHDAE